MAGAMLAAFAIFLGFQFPQWRLRGRTVRIGIRSDYVFLGYTEGKPTGLMVDVFEKAAERKSMKVEWVQVPMGADEALKTGVIDIWSGMAKTPERSRVFHITEPWLSNDFCLVARKPNPRHTPADFIGRRVALVDGPVTRMLATEHLPGVIQVLVTNRRASLTAVCKGQAEAAFLDMRMLHGFLLDDREGCDGVGLQADPVRNAALRLGITAMPRNAVLAEAFFDGIESLRADGTFSALLEHWIPFSMQETELLFHEQELRHRNIITMLGLTGALLLMALLLWQNRRVNRARRAAEVANVALQESVEKSRAALQRLRFQVDRMPIAYIEWDTRQRVTEWSGAAERIFGWTAEEACGRTEGELISPATPGSDLEARWKQVIEGDEQSYGVHENTHRDGRLLECEWFNRALRDKDGRVSGVLSMANDTTERKLAEKERTRLEEELQQSQKLESIGRLAGGIAHDFNNLLTVINGYCDVLMKELRAGDPIRQLIVEIRGAGLRAAALTRQLLTFSRKQLVAQRPSDLNILVSENLTMLQRMVGEDIELVTELAPDLGAVMADPSQFQQVLMNLVVNARDAMPGGGRLTLETANVELDGEASRDGVASGSYVLLAISDTGTGISEGIRDRIFEPFFTTKGEGTGLGLSTVYGIVRQSGGSIRVESEAGSGARFEIHLPSIGPRSAAPQNSAAPADALHGCETVLVVEDQEEVRKLAVMILRQLGYKVLQAASGFDALGVAEKHAGEIHLLLTDVIMPRMSGRELVDRMKQVRPEIRTLYMSGYTADVRGRSGPIDSENDFIAKPFSPVDLAAKVREVMSQ